MRSGIVRPVLRFGLKRVLYSARTSACEEVDFTIRERFQLRIAVLSLAGGGAH
eukprot:COSAG03_NODE_982_length_5115_cov_9.263357_2_plen_53_part_00